MPVEKFFQRSAVATQLVRAPPPEAREKYTEFCLNKGKVIKVNVYMVFIEVVKEYLLHLKQPAFFSPNG